MRREQLRPASSSSSSSSSSPPPQQQQLQTAPSALTTAVMFTRHRWLRLLAAAAQQLSATPRAESALKYTGGFVAALVAMRYARSLASAGLIGLFAGIVAHSLYADVLKKPANVRPPVALPAPEDDDDESDADSSDNSAGDVRA